MVEADQVKVFKPNKYAKEKADGRKYINVSINDPDWWELKSMAMKNGLSVQAYVGMILRHHVSKYDK
jgi:predicted DNA binding CopG/RHH family protein